MQEFKPGDKVVKNPDKWIPNEFDSWGRGEGVGEVIHPPFELTHGEVDVRWPSGRCFEKIEQLMKLSDK